MSARRDEIRARALDELRRHEVVLDGHFDFGNGFHGTSYVNPHQLFRYPSTIWRVAQDLLDVIPSDILERTEVVAGPVTGGALLAHTIAGLLDGRRPLTHPPLLFAPFGADDNGRATLADFYMRVLAGKRVLMADDVRYTGQRLGQCAELVEEAGGEVVGTVQIVDRTESQSPPRVPNIALVEYKAAANYRASDCPLCRKGAPLTTF